MPVIGSGFNSNGRYGQGALMRGRIIPRVLEAGPASPGCWPNAMAMAGPIKKVFVYAAGGYYYPGQDHGKLAVFPMA